MSATLNQDFHRVLQDVKQRKLQPIYFLEGEEPFFIDQVIAEIQENLLTPEEKEFNLSVFYGRDSDIDDILATARRYPMMSEFNVVVVREAQHLKRIENLENYCNQPIPSTILAIAFKGKKLDKRKSLAKSLKKSAVFIESKKLYENQVPQWIEDYCRSLKMGIEPLAVKMLADHQGSDLAQLSNSLNKLRVLMGEGAAITPQDVEKNIGISREYNVFEFVNAIGRRDKQKVFRIARFFARNPKNGHPVFVIDQVYNFFSKLLIFHSQRDKTPANISQKLKVHRFFVKDYETAARYYSPKQIVKVMRYLRKYDLGSKGKDMGSAKESDILRELSFVLMNI